jgi:hypothetical protein
MKPLNLIPLLFLKLNRSTCNERLSWLDAVLNFQQLLFAVLSMNHLEIGIYFYNTHVTAIDIKMGLSFRYAHLDEGGSHLILQMLSRPGMAAGPMGYFPASMKRSNFDDAPGRTSRQSNHSAACLTSDRETERSRTKIGLFRPSLSVRPALPYVRQGVSWDLQAGSSSGRGFWAFTRQTNTTGN